TSSSQKPSKTSRRSQRPSRTTRALPGSPSSPRPCVPRSQKETRAMRTVLATIAVAALAIGLPAAGFGADPDQKSQTPTIATEGDASTPEASETGGKGEESASGDQAGS